MRAVNRWPFVSLRTGLAWLLAGLAIAWSAGPSAQVPGIPGSLVFYSIRHGNNEIYRANPDATDAQRLTFHAASDVDPAISPNGRDVIFTSNRTGNNDIHLVDSRGGQAWNLTEHGANDGWARWSPNGHQIVFHSDRDGNFEIYVMNGDGSDPRRLTNYAGIDMFPDWSPNGQEIVFRRDSDIHVLDLFDHTIRKLTNAAALNQMATWSPNGRQLAFMSTRDGYPSVFVMNADGSGQVNLTPKDPTDLNSEWTSRAPSWSTNGRHIYFMSFRPATQGDTELFVMNRDGSGLQRLTMSPGADGSPRTR
jgi:Tol biopolymer transport system component